MYSLLIFVFILTTSHSIAFAQLGITGLATPGGSNKDAQCTTAGQLSPCEPGQLQHDSAAQITPALGLDVNSANPGYIHQVPTGGSLTASGPRTTRYSASTGAVGTVSNHEGPPTEGTLCHSSVPCTAGVATPVVVKGNLGAEPTFDFSAGSVQSGTLNADSKFTLSNPTNGQVYTLILTQDSTGGRTITWPANVKFPNAIRPTVNLQPYGVTYVTLVYDSTNYQTTLANNITGPGSSQYAIFVCGSKYCAKNLKTGSIDYQSADLKDVRAVVQNTVGTGNVDVYFGPGTFTTPATSIVLSGVRNVRLFGAGRGATILRTTESGYVQGAILSFGTQTNPSAHITVAHLTFQGVQKANNAGYGGIAANYTTHLTIFDNEFKALPDDAIYVGPYSAHLTIIGNYFTSIGGNTGAAGTVAAATRAGIELEGTLGAGTGDGAPHHVVIDGNRFEALRGPCVALNTNSSSRSILNVTIANNVCDAAYSNTNAASAYGYGTYGAISVSGWGPCCTGTPQIAKPGYIAITGNTITNSPAGNGIFLHANYTTVTGNVIHGNAANGIHVQTGTAGLEISGNHIRANTGRGINLMTHTTDVHVDANVVSNNTAGQIASASPGDGYSRAIGCNYLGTINSVTCGQSVGLTAFLFANIGSYLTADGQYGFCLDCTTSGGNPGACMGGGTGAQAMRLNGVNRCWQ